MPSTSQHNTCRQCGGQQHVAMHFSVPLVGMSLVKAVYKRWAALHSSLQCGDTASARDFVLDKAQVRLSAPCLDNP